MRWDKTGQLYCLSQWNRKLTRLNKYYKSSLARCKDFIFTDWQPVTSSQCSAAGLLVIINICEHDQPLLKTTSQRSKSRNCNVSNRGNLEPSQKICSSPRQSLARGVLIAAFTNSDSSISLNLSCDWDAEPGAVPLRMTWKACQFMPFTMAKFICSFNCFPWLWGAPLQGHTINWLPLSIKTEPNINS